MTHGYDDWYEEAAPWLNVSSPPSASRCLAGSTSASRRARLPLTLMLIVIAFALLAIASASGCANNRTVFIPEDSPIRVGPSTKAKVYTLINGEWVLSGNTVTIPEGWYCVPPSFVKE